MPRVDVEVQRTVLRALLHYYAVSKVADSALQTTPAVTVVLFVTMVQQLVLLDVQKPTAATLINVADLAVLHSGHAILTAHALQQRTLQFLQDCLHVTEQLLHTVLKITKTSQNGTVLDITNLFSSLTL